MAEFIAVNLTKPKKIKKISVDPQKIAPIALQLRLAEFAALSTIMHLKKFAEFVKTLSCAELSFLTVVIVKTNFGALSNVPISYTEINESQNLTLPTFKKIRKKLISLGLITVATKRMKKGGGDFSNYSINPETFKTLFLDEPTIVSASPHLKLVRN